MSSLVLVSTHGNSNFNCSGKSHCRAGFLSSGMSFSIGTASYILKVIDAIVSTGNAELNLLLDGLACY